MLKSLLHAAGCQAADEAAGGHDGQAAAAEGARPTLPRAPEAAPGRPPGHAHPRAVRPLAHPHPCPEGPPPQLPLSPGEPAALSLILESAPATSACKMLTELATCITVSQGPQNGGRLVLSLVFPCSFVIHGVIFHFGHPHSRKTVLRPKSEHLGGCCRRLHGRAWRTR